MLAIFFAFLAFLGWGSGDIFSVYASRRVGAFRTSFWVSALTLVYAAVLGPFFVHQLTHLTPGVLVLNVLLGVFVTIAYTAFAEALRIGTPSVVGTISGSFPALVVILSIVFLGETLSAPQVAAIATILIGLVLTSLNLAELKRDGLNLNRSVILALVAFAGWGVYFTFIKIPVSHIGWFWPDMISALTSILVLLCFDVQRVKLSRHDLHRGLTPLALVTLISGGAMLAYNAALQVGSASVVAPIAGAYPVLFVILASILFKDPVTRLQRAGMVVTLAGIVGLSFASN